MKKDMMSHETNLKLEWNYYGNNKKSAQAFLDFMLDGQSLYGMIKKRGFDLISCLGWGPLSEQVKGIKRLLLEATADFPNDRRSIYICPLCGDLGCGAISVIIEKDRDHYIWRAMGYENNYDDDSLDLESLEEIGPLYFNVSNYEHEIKAALNYPPNN